VSTDRTAEQIKQLMVENLTYSGSWSDVDDDYPLLAKHVIDSLGMLKLVSLIEEEFDVEIDDDDVVPANWKTIRDIAALVASKRSPAE
jgi:acyl carrier protein